MYKKGNKLFLKILFIQITFSTYLFSSSSGLWNKINNEANGAKGMFSSDGATLNGPLSMAVKFLIMFIGIILLGMGIHEAFVSEDKGGEGKKSKGLLKMIGGALFIAIMPFISWINSTERN